MRIRNAFAIAAGFLALACGATPDAREPTRTPAARPQLVAFYVPWEPPALASLRANVERIDVFSPMWASLVSPKGEVRWESDPEAHAILAKAARRPKVFPIVTNAHDDVWDAPAAEGVIVDPAASEAMAEGLIRQAKADGLSGFVMDFENLTPTATAGYAAFLARMRDRLKPQGLEVWVTTTLTAEDKLGPEIGKATDAVVLMAYDQCWATSTAGPIAADAWLEQNLRAKIGTGDPRRYVVALASYGYDWPQGRKAEVVAAPAASTLAARTGQTIEHPPGSGAHFGYTAASGTRHDVWWLDGADFARQRAMIEQHGVRGVALWRMGLEDPDLWTARAPAPPPPPAGPTATCEPLPRR